MKRILLVDDDQMYFETAIDALEMINPDYNVTPAPNGIEALDILKNKKIDLIISDIQMPVMNGIEFLTKVRQKYPNTPIILMTAFGTKALRDQASELGALYFFEKTMDFIQLAKKIDEAITKGTQGYLKGIPLPTFLQLIGLEKKSCTVIIKTHLETGFLYIKNGLLINAETDSLTGEEACFEIISWEEPDLEIQYTMRHKEQTIFNSMNHILMEALRLNDETANDGKKKEKKIKNENKDKKKPVASIKVLNKKQIEILEEKFKELSGIQDFCGGCIYSDKGENLTIIDTAKNSLNIPDICQLALNFFTVIQEKSFDLGTGIGKMIHINTDKAHILAKTISISLKVYDNEKKELPLILVLVLESGTNIGLANLKTSTIIRDINNLLAVS